MNRNARRKIIGGLSSLILLFILVEAGLRLFDPLGIWRWYNNLDILEHHKIGIEGRGYGYRPGFIRLHGWSVTILPDGGRQVPHTALDANCTLVFLGDSYTFGMGVSDEETWIDLLARDFPTAHMINAGIPGYSSAAIEAVYHAYPDAHAFIYLTIGNDDQAVFVFTPQSRSAVFALRSYAVILMDTRIEKYDHDPARLYRNLDVLTGDTRLTLVAFDTAYGQALKTQYPIMFIPTFENPISWMDRHANEKGNQEIAASMLPIVKRVIQRGCS